MMDFRKFLRAHWADETQLCQWLTCYGATPPTKPAAAKWFSRESLPANWFATLLILLEIENGAPESLIPYRR